MRRTAPLIALLVAVALLATAVPATARSPIAMGASNPEGGGPDLAKVIAAVEAHKADIGEYPAMWSLWSRWGGGVAGPWEACEPNKDSCAFPSEAVDWLHSKDITPVIWWLPHDPGNANSNLYGRYKRIVKGKHNAYIKQWFRDARDAGKAARQQYGGKRRVIVRFAHEATGHWFPWSIKRKDNTLKSYKKAWRKLNNMAKSTGARPHIRWMWANVWPRKKEFPGNFIDFVGVTVLNFGSDREWRPAKKLIDNRGKASRGFTKKPVIVAEIGTHWKGGDKPTWIRQAYIRAYKKQPWVKGFLWLETNEPAVQRGHPDWRLGAPFGQPAQAGLAAYKRLVDDPRFKGQIR